MWYTIGTYQRIDEILAYSVCLLDSKGDYHLIAKYDVSGDGEFAKALAESHIARLNGLPPH